MNRNLIPLAILAAGIALPAHAFADGPVPGAMQGQLPAVRAYVNCNTFDVDISGLHADTNTRIIVMVGNEPPYIYNLTTEDQLITQLKVGVAEQGTIFQAAIGIDEYSTGYPNYPFMQTVDCSNTVKVALPQAVEVEVSDPPVVTTLIVPEEGSDFFASVALAPPW